MFLLICLVVGAVGLFWLLGTRERVLYGSAQLNAERTHESEPFELETGSVLPAYRVRIRGSVGTNQELTYAVSVVGEQGAEAFSYEQTVWKEFGRWQEGGESGTWTEAELDRDFVFVPHEAGTYRLRLSVSEMQALRGAKQSKVATLAYEVHADVGSTLPVLLGLLALLAAFGVATVMVFGSGATLEAAYLTDEDIKHGGELTFEVGSPGTLHDVWIKLDLDPGAGYCDDVSVLVTVRGPGGLEVRIPYEAAVKTSTDENGSVVSRRWRGTVLFVPAVAGAHVLRLDVQEGRDQVYDGELRIKEQRRTVRDVEAWYLDPEVAA